MQSSFAFLYVFIKIYIKIYVRAALFRSDPAPCCPSRNIFTAHGNLIAASAS